LNGCDGTFECRQLRGGLFEVNASSTFAALGDYDLGLAPQLGLDSSAYYGLDELSFDPDTSEAQQVVAIVNSTNYWTGSLGLGMDNTTLGSKTASSLLSSLFQDGKIPSQSFGYTAGAPYRLAKVPASLTLGGYDANRFEPNGVSFNLSSDKQPVLAINSIKARSPGDADSDILFDYEQAIFTIDSTTPFLWLPPDVARRFVNQVGLDIYDDDVNTYLFPTGKSLLSDVKAKNITYDFEFADYVGAETKLTLNIPVAAFLNSNLSYGFPGLNTTVDGSAPYFPVRIASNASQYTIGRAFLQESYLTVDYARNNFSISQAKFAGDAVVNTNLVDIAPTTSRSEQSVPTGEKSSTPGISKGAVIGIAIGAVAIAVAIITLAVVIILHRRRRRPATSKEVSSSSSASTEQDGSSRHGLARLLLGSKRGKGYAAELAAREVDPESPGASGLPSSRNKDKQRLVEVDPDNEIKELPAAATFAAELPGSPVPELGTHERRSSIAKSPLRDSGLYDGHDGEAAPTYHSSQTASSHPHSHSVVPTPRALQGASPSLPSPATSGFGTSTLAPTGTDGISSPESTNGPTMSSFSSAGHRTPDMAGRSPLAGDTPTYTLDETQTFELRPPGLVGSLLRREGERKKSETEEPAVRNDDDEGDRRFSWENSMGGDTRLT
jgi:hypothetical protein